MLRRHQVLLTDWLVEYAKFLSKKYDISLSEAIRVLMSLAIIQTTHELYPQFKLRNSIKSMIESTAKASYGTMKEEVLHNYISEIYFDARKASEFRISQEKKNARK